MKLAIGLARQGEGLTRPNPPVGAVIVNQYGIAGKGFHRRAGADHAEIIALKRAGAQAEKATLYATLEPCRTFGRTPPCVDAVIKSGIRRVVVAVSDPNPRHAGRGLSILRKAGIEVITGVCSDEGRKLIEPFTKWIFSGLPYVSLKMAMSYDGKTADYRGCSRWITGKEARCFVHGLRRRVDAILVGAGTVLADDPSLLPKPSKERHPFRIILDARGIVSPTARILSDSASARTIMATTLQCPRHRRDEWGRRGARVWLLPANRGGVSIPALMRKIGRMGLLHVLCEGGAEVAAALIRAKAVDEYFFFIAPRLIGGVKSKGAVGGKGWQLDAAPGLCFQECRGMGRDILIRAKPG